MLVDDITTILKSNVSDKQKLQEIEEYIEINKDSINGEKNFLKSKRRYYYLKKKDDENLTRKQIEELKNLEKEYNFGNRRKKKSNNMDEESDIYDNSAESSPERQEE